MHNEFTAIIEEDNGWYIAYCPEIPGANGLGKTVAASRKNLAAAIALILKDRREHKNVGAKNFSPLHILHKRPRQ